MSNIEPKKPKNKEWVRPFWFLFNIGWYVALSIVIPTAIGFWVDRPERLDSHPIFTLVGFSLGTILAFYGLYRMLRQFQADQQAEQRVQQKEHKEPKE